MHVPLFEANWLIGAAPGQGKTASVRVLACAAALDPVCDLWVHELAGRGDLEAFAQVSRGYVQALMTSRSATRLSPWPCSALRWNNGPATSRRFPASSGRTGS